MGVNYYPACQLKLSGEAVPQQKLMWLCYKLSSNDCPVYYFFINCECVTRDLTSQIKLYCSNCAVKSACCLACWLCHLPSRVEIEKKVAKNEVKATLRHQMYPAISLSDR